VSAAPGHALPPGYALRELHDDDAEELHALIVRNRPRLQQWIHWAREQTLEDTRAFLARARRREQEELGHSRAVLADQALAGVVGISVDEANRSAAIGYWVDEASEGKGVVSVAVAAILDEGFERWGLMRVEIRADVRNRPSCAIAERLGFQLEGVLRQAYRVGESYSDDAVYSMLASDPARAALRRGARLAAASE
jgi:ribosomal-protein-serine acetyltransferase